MANSSMFTFFIQCFKIPSTQYHLIAYTLVNVPFVLPLCLYILYQGAQQWRSRARISHTHFFTYNVVFIQVMGSLGSALLVINILLRNDVIFLICIYMFFISSSAIVVFQVVTCMERYMAALHPVTYLSLKSQTWSLIRNLCCAFVWLQCVVQTVFLKVIDSVTGYFIYTFTGLFFSLVIVLICNLCVLWALLRPGPGGGAKGNTSKQKRLLTITAITGALLLKFTGDLNCLVIYFQANIVKDSDIERSCALYFSTIWFTLPSTLVLPLLFLQRNEKVLRFKMNEQRVIK